MSEARSSPKGCRLLSRAASKRPLINNRPINIPVKLCASLLSIICAFQRALWNKAVGTNLLFSFRWFSGSGSLLQSRLATFSFAGAPSLRDRTFLR